jgi:hypothetical protein
MTGKVTCGGFTAQSHIRNTIPIYQGCLFLNVNHPFMCETHDILLTMDEISKSTKPWGKWQGISYGN